MKTSLNAAEVQINDLKKRVLDFLKSSKSGQVADVLTVHGFGNPYKPHKLLRDLYLEVLDENQSPIIISYRLNKAIERLADEGKIIVTPQTYDAKHGVYMRWLIWVKG